MKRNEFLQTLAYLPITASLLPLNALGKLVENLDASPEMPVLFLGHGSPMNAIEENEFVKGFREIAKTLPKPKAILCISAHWETNGSFVTAMPKPRTIHDFGGFPKELYQQQYPAPGHPLLAKEINGLIAKTSVKLDTQWGLDHGAWTVIKHLYPKADVPVIQFSLDYTKDPLYHYELAQQLMPLRRKGVLIIGSGNIVHNLRLVAWDKLNKIDFAFEWALEAREKMNQYLKIGDHQKLIHYQKQGKAFELAIPTPEHYLPLLYTLGLQHKNEKLQVFNDKAVGGSLTMTSLKIGG
ncbi:MAG: 4,5-DOPA dioxygenase extradiol [Saprospiraceae bacterium]|nr:4,5-DOPA dioxygenase extradiol [Saprospiraceae bacterium]